MGVFDWEEDEGGEVERELLRMQRLGRGNGHPLTRGEFYAMMEMHVRDTAIFHKRIEKLEATVYAPKRFLLAMFWTGWGKLVLLLLALVVGIALAEAREHLNFDWLWDSAP